ncbi:hypothetical protein [Pararhodospirillum oryzae]|uniref:Uncharacterized protein n=1 Tax=Pararhodospirillum oryzae TaxID=478448 RepID=A0A512H931_9PROT|nr:hypothetical protein [Pararhodospirillum oryzae]GEO81918.1 hypothetical protein ROR02_20490 [Pararhodospirillum oryzae]
MIRAVLSLLLPVILPSVAWLAWVHGARAWRRRRGLPEDGPVKVPVLALVAAGLALMILAAGLIYWGETDRGLAPGVPYTPPRASDVDLNAWPVEPRP